jgi:hypothetical protein
MGMCSIGQTFSVLSYSQLYFIPMALISRAFSSSQTLRIGLLMPALLIQPLSAHRLSSLLVPEDRQLSYGLAHLGYGCALVLWILFKFT